MKRIPSHDPEPMQAIYEQRAKILGDFKLGAGLGYMAADALIGRLFDTHRDELAEDRRQLDVLEQGLAAHMRRFDALFPPPVEPPPMPPQGRRLGRISEALGRSGNVTRH